MRGVAFAVLLSVLLLGATASPVVIHPVRAVGTIYIRMSGSIDPPTANITSADNVTYTFTSDIQDSIAVERNDIVVDGAGYAIQGSKLGEAIRMYARSNVTLRNMKITRFLTGVRVDDSSTYITVYNITFVSLFEAMIFWAPQYVTIASCLILDCFVGIDMWYPNDVTITQNTLAGND